MAILTSNWSLDVAVAFSAAFLAAYLYMTRNFKYWAKRGVVEIPPVPFVGNLLDCILLRTSVPKFYEALYNRAEGLPYVGYYMFHKPTLLLRDPNLVKHIMIKDFAYFPNRYVGTYEGDSIASGNIFLMKNSMWKHVRPKISPMFTSGKIKKMFELMSVIGNYLDTHLNNLEAHGDGREIEIKDISSKYTIDVIATCAFGLDGNCLNDPESLFTKYGVKIFGLATFMRCLEFATFFFAPNIARLLKLNFFSKEGTEFMRKVFTDTMNLRMESGTRRNDLIDLLIDIKKSQDQYDDPDAFKIEGDILIGQAATFFAAGYETSATTMSFALYELALNPDVQSRLREDINAALEENGGKITYELVMGIPYLDMVMSEALRKHPSLAILDRVAIRDYKVPGSDLIIEQGTTVHMSLLGLHYDPEYFPEPEKFIPERFSEENKKKIPTGAYIPFGEGPRICVGLRFGLLTTKMGVLRFILNYEISPSARTTIPMRYDTKAVMLKSAGGLYLHVRQITPATKSSS